MALSRRLLPLLLVLGLVLPLAAQEPVAPVGPEGFPGTAEVIPRLAQLTEAAAKTEAKVAALQETASFSGQLASARERQNELAQRISQLGEPAGWNLERLQEVRGLLVERKDTLDKLLAAISVRLEELDGIRLDWSARRQFWQGWQTSLQGRELKAQEKAFAQALNTIAGVLARAAAASPPLVALQQEVTSLQERNLEQLGRVEAALAAQRREVFRKTAPSFANPAFYRQFDAVLWAKVRTGVAQVQTVDSDFLRQQGWVAVFQSLLAVAVAGFILRHRHRAEVTREWQFILRHPWATGVFVAVTALSFLYSRPPGPWRLGLWALAAFSAAVLISGLLRNPRKIFMVNLLAALLVLSLGLQVIAFPQPLYRLYLALLSLLGVPLLWLLAARNQAARGGQADGFTLALRLAAAVLAVSLLAQCGGYTALASLLVEAPVETVFIGLLAAMAIRLGRGGIEFLMGHEWVRRTRFSRRFGQELEGRLKGVLQVFVIGYAAFYLLVVWDLYGSVGQAWREILAMKVTWGEVSVTVEMALLVVLVLYLAIVSSWVLRAFLETEIFPRKGIERGVRDSIRKLLHYSLVVIGFLLAMSLAGVELRNFVVLAGAFGIGIGFGLQNIVNNFVSGIILLFERPVKVGDVVVLEGEWGTVKKIGLRSTVVETLDQAEIIVPNSQLISEKVTNWTLTNKAARLVVPVGVAYGSDVARVLAILREVGERHPEVLSDPPPASLFLGFGDSALDFELRVWLADISKRFRVRSELNEGIDQRFRAEGVEIPFPQRDLHLRSVDAMILRKLRQVPGEGEDKG